MAPITLAILTISLVALVGLLLGSVRVRGIGLGSAGVLFAGILFGHLGATVDHEVATFAKEFGLILFVFAIGLQLGPGIVRLWRQQGLLLNSMAVAIVGQGIAMVLLFRWLFDMPLLTAAGLFSGATTNTPALGAAQQAAAMSEGTPGGIESLTSAYAVAYPGGIIGIILSMLVIRRLFRVDLDVEEQELADSYANSHEPLERQAVLVDNFNIAATPFDQIPGIDETGVRISRVQRCGEDVVQTATGETELHKGDIVLVVGPRSGLQRFIPLIGHPSELDLMERKGNVQWRRVYVTEPQALQRSLRDLSLDKLYNTTVTRIIRSGVEMTARGSSRFNYGDVAHIVGDKDSLDRATEFLGNSTKSIAETRFSPLFAGIAAGVFVGTLPITLPGLPFPVRLGLAGGPLLAAILFSLIGSVGKFVWYIPFSANLALRELGIILFLACAGLSAGETFFASALSLQGAKWIAAGFCITIVPLLTTGIAARVYGRQNYLTICGVIAGSMTDPPALAFANSLADSEASSTAYAAVYPLTMVLRIIAAQAIVLFAG